MQNENNTLENKDDNKPEFLQQIFLHGCFDGRKGTLRDDE